MAKEIHDYIEPRDEVLDVFLLAPIRPPFFWEIFSFQTASILHTLQPLTGEFNIPICTMADHDTLHLRIARN